MDHGGAMFQAAAGSNQRRFAVADGFRIPDRGQYSCRQDFSHRDGKVHHAGEIIDGWLSDMRISWHRGGGDPAPPISLVYDGARHASKTTGLSGFRGARLKPRLVFYP